MLYYLGQLGESLTAFNVFRYITFRTAGAVVTALFFVFLFGPQIIAGLRIRQGKGQPIREDGPQGHLLTKKGTPTMGGLMILAGTVISTLLWSNLSNVYVWAVLFVTVSFGAIGFYDDYLKVKRMSHKGFAGWQRLVIEAIVALIASYVMAAAMEPKIATQLMFPFIKGSGLPLWYFFYFFAAFIIVGAGNSVNFTDGLDGLAIVPVMIAAGCFGLIAYLVGSATFSEYLLLNNVPGTGELAVLCGALIGAGLGFLWFNAPPAQIFMGDTGSLALGGALGAIAVATKHEIVLAIVGGLFVLETVSVIVQVVSFKLTGKRVFKMAPIHHHFEMMGWTESQVVIRFWIISFVLALIGLSELKLRSVAKRNIRSPSANQAGAMVRMSLSWEPPGRAARTMFARDRKTPLAEWWWTIDKQLLSALILLMAVGMMLSFAASPPVAERLGLNHWYFIIRHAMFDIMALPVLIGVSFLSHRHARWLSLAVLVGSIVLLWLTLKLGVEVKGAKRWVSIVGNTIQPSEFVKPAYAIVAAWLFSESMQQKGVFPRIIATLIMFSIVAGLLLQPDIGQTSLMLATWAALLFLSGISWFLILGLMGLGVGGLFAAYYVFPHFAKRIDAFLNPEGGGNTYQVDKALNSLLEGGWFGRGPGESLAKKVIPDAHADYVFSAAAGEFGILFCLVLVALIVFIVMRALAGAQQQSTLFARLAVATLAIQFGLQCAINLSVNLNLIPPKGMTLPFVSYGGTSTFAIAFGMGLILALTRRRPEESWSTGIPTYRPGTAVVPAE